MRKTCVANRRCKLALQVDQCNITFKCGIADLYGTPRIMPQVSEQPPDFFKISNRKALLSPMLVTVWRWPGGIVVPVLPPSFPFPSREAMHVRKLPGIPCAFTEGSLAGWNSSHGDKLLSLLSDSYWRLIDFCDVSRRFWLQCKVH